MNTPKQSVEMQPKMDEWRGMRIIFCTEPNASDTINGILKKLTGGDQSEYGLLYSDENHICTPQFKLILMCNNSPKLDVCSGALARLTMCPSLETPPTRSSCSTDMHVTQT